MYKRQAEEWLGHDYESGSMILRGNVLRAGHDTRQLAFFMIGGSGDIDIYLGDNLIVDLVGKTSIPEVGSYTTAPVKVNRLKTPPALPVGVELLPRCV